MEESGVRCVRAVSLCARPTRTRGASYVNNAGGARLGKGCVSAHPGRAGKNDARSRRPTSPRPLGKRDVQAWMEHLDRYAIARKSHLVHHAPSRYLWMRGAKKEPASFRKRALSTSYWSSWSITRDLHRLNVIGHVELGQIGHPLPRRKGDLRSLEICILVRADGRIGTDDHALDIVVPILAVQTLQRR